MDFVILAIIFLFLCYALFKYFEPRIDVVLTGRNTFDVYLWYSDYDRYGKKRKYVRIWRKGP